MNMIIKLWNPKVNYFFFVLIVGVLNSDPGMKNSLYFQLSVVDILPEAWNHVMYAI
jgi:hypothetical protein